MPVSVSFLFVVYGIVRCWAETWPVILSDVDGKVLIEAPECFWSDHYEVPAGVQRIGSWVFQEQGTLKSVKFPVGMTIISRGAFQGCTALESVTFSEELNTVEAWAFKDCTSLRSVDFPVSVTKGGKYVFNGCTALQTLTIRNPEAEVEFFNSGLDYRVVQHCTIRAPKRSKVWKAAEKAGVKCVPLEE